MLIDLSIFITQSDKGDGGLARDPGPYSWPPWPPVPSVPPAHAPATTPQYVRHIEGLRAAPPALRAAPLPWKVVVVVLDKYQISMYIT